EHRQVPVAEARRRSAVALVVDRKPIRIELAGTLVQRQRNARQKLGRSRPAGLDRRDKLLAHAGGPREVELGQARLFPGRTDCIAVDHPSILPSPGQMSTIFVVEFYYFDGKPFPSFHPPSRNLLAPRSWNGPPRNRGNLG